MKYRMYGLVNYQLSGTIHGGIQFGHAVVEYELKSRMNPIERERYDKWANESKTFVILNGGTTNDDPLNFGLMQQSYEKLKYNNIFLAEFREPDLNNSLTAIAILVDERVYDKITYPSPLPWASEKELTKFEELIGGKQNLFLREFLGVFNLL